ncbi:MAG: PIN domain-containing protein [Candidatus Electrothrix aestuarii]|uniref:PIN domain-containing protein n=1 Tax=Candidatus Electrothrix aestuarii TaxID=3062594 RepID=A0AAU8LVA4_9BACT|nr:PIN domain-containing protein [Candidatus Electrothrix aestuarii]WPD22165.1 MAG: PIN domain-containing protein [Candidatus Electrothrix sp. GW3-3]
MKLSRLLIDTNLLVLFIVGSASTDYIPKHKKLTAFTVEDYEVLLKIVAQATEILVTPNTLTETSNLVSYIGEPARSQVLQCLRFVITESKEKYVSSSLVAQRPEFVWLGLTDAALLEASVRDVTLLTTDFNLYCAALKKGDMALNFNHIRDQYL